MTTTEPQVADTARFSQREAADILGIHRNTLRRYTEQHLIRCGYRRTSGRPYYTGRALRQLWRSQL